MKNLLFIIVLVLTTKISFAQFIMVEEKGGDIQYQKITNIEKITFGTPPTFGSCGDVLLYEGKYYRTVQIGTRCWFKENLNIGTRINKSSDQTDNSTIEKYCYNNDEANCNVYGGLYQWNEAMQYITTEGTQGICPTGWHIPTKLELETLNETVGGSSNALKLVGQGSNGGAGINTSGFSALLAGYRLIDFGYASFTGLSGIAYFWSSKEFDSTGSRYLSLDFNSDNVTFNPKWKTYGFSIRCLKD